ncbi:MAG TPA: hypothetical protein VH187_01510 [Scandinavium sp.]|jgi:hypothetical protein|uniref:hypothetical protein n=1 Tax=Scandinavium sp. TaxID=2830653 RepID=UPI002E372ACC|nr:hypothetical protein [Scandinavium sp.]HEX4499835.1 hypothetical protein [Scandinavium sp.]
MNKVPRLTDFMMTAGYLARSDGPGWVWRRDDPASNSRCEIECDDVDAREYLRNPAPHEFAALGTWDKRDLQIWHPSRICRNATVILKAALTLAQALEAAEQLPLPPPPPERGFWYYDNGQLEHDDSEYVFDAAVLKRFSKNW